MKRLYFDFDPTKGYPANEAIFYECIMCGGSIPSFPTDSIGCSCGNIFIDVGGARVSVGNHAMMKMYTELK